MSKRYPSIAFTEHVKAVQDTYGSGAFLAKKAARGAKLTEGDVLTNDVRTFLAGRDTFYLATTSETGWPYIQIRGGAQGFLRLVDEHTIGWADFRGNLHYISAGNLATDDRVAIIVLDYPSRLRLKIYGRARVARVEDEPALAEQLHVPGYEATVERAVLVTVEAFDWNCPQHITPRYSMAELEEPLAPIHARLEELEAENARLRAALAARPDGL